MYARIAPDHEWARQRVATLPAPWQREILGNWQRQHRQDTYTANRNLRLLADSLGNLRLPLDATDADICDTAASMAEHCFSLGAVYHDADTLHAAMVRACKRMGIEPPDGQGQGYTQAGEMARMTDQLWWRRRLRRHQGREVERAAIQLGRVNKSRECYVSTRTVERRQQQHARNAATLEATTAQNELGQEFTLAELAAKGPSNRAIKRAELMTRIAGFERIAQASGHVGIFATLTCPSRFHRWRTVKNGGVIPNPAYENLDPREGAGYLARTWAKIRAALHRAKVDIYGFRVAEPQQDGTPHFHFLLFMQSANREVFRAIFRKWGLKDTPNEPGAHAHRVDIKDMDATRGTAAGYIAKYIAKNIDGYGLEKDLLGNDAITASQRIDAWASTWGIRQFQQVGGAPVTPWRELRRVESVPAGAPAHLIEAHRAVNKTPALEATPTVPVSWAQYITAQGGPNVGRDYRVRVTMEEPGTLNRYGEPSAAKPTGVETWGQESYTQRAASGLEFKRHRAVYWFVASVRHQWRIGHKRGGEICARSAPWTRVINCTGGVPMEGLSSGQIDNGCQIGISQGATGNGPVRETGFWHDSGPAGSHGGQPDRTPGTNRSATAAS